jgi:hypothetical protein
MLRLACVAHYVTERKVLNVNTACFERSHASKLVGVNSINCTFVFSSVSVFARNIDGTGAAAAAAAAAAVFGGGGGGVLCNVFRLSLHYSDK